MKYFTLLLLLFSLNTTPHAQNLKYHAKFLQKTDVKKPSGLKNYERLLHTGYLVNYTDSSIFISTFRQKKRGNLREINVSDIDYLDVLNKERSETGILAGTAIGLSLGLLLTNSDDGGIVSPRDLRIPVTLVTTAIGLISGGVSSSKRERIHLLRSLQGKKRLMNKYFPNDN